MARPFPEDEGPAASKAMLYVEDALILLAVAALFVLGVFFRHTWWGMAGLAVVGVVMAVVCFFRLRRAHRAFTDRGDD
jgi:membrane protein YdbS with pleckstrin-like domain